MKRLLVLIFCLALPFGLMAQSRSGSISGTVTDSEGNPLPGVSLTLTGETIAPMSTVSSAEGKFRFLSLYPANDYVIKAELQGFKTKLETGVIVNIAKDSNISISMEQGALEEQVTVIAQTPIIQAKKTQITHTVNAEMLAALPSARDPWVVLQMTPGVQVDRENVGGTESGQQSYYFAKGSTTQEWTMDGMQITDRNSGGSPGYYDFDMFEELNISTGTLDVEHRDPGVVVNIVTRRGGNKLSLGARFFYTDEKFQATISPEKKAEIGLTRGYNRAIDIKDFGFNAGGPFVKDKAWWWVSYGVQQVLTLNTVDKRDDTYLNNYNAKLNFQLIPSNRLEVLYSLGDKKKYGRSSSATFPEGYIQGSKFHFGNPTWKIQDEQMVGDNLFLSLRVGKSNPGFGFKPGNDPDLLRVARFDYAQYQWVQSQSYFYSNRPHPYYVGQVQYFNDNIMGTAHEIKVGFEINPNSRTYEGGYNGNIRLWDHYYEQTVDWDLADEDPDTPGVQLESDFVEDEFGLNITYIATNHNDYPYDDGTKRYAGYFSDVISAGRFNINIGLRVDRGWNYVNPWTTRGLFAENGTGNFAHYADAARSVLTQDAIDAIIGLQPDMVVDDVIKPPKIYTTFSPRFGLTYDIFGDGKTIAKLAYTMYPGGGLGTGYTTPGGMYPWLDFYGVDTDDDGLFGLNELYWTDYYAANNPAYRVFDDEGTFIADAADVQELWWGGQVDFGGSAVTDPTTFVDTNTWKYSLTHEVNVSVDREIMKDFGVTAGFTWKKMGRFSWTNSYYPATGHIRDKDDYVLGGTLPDTLINPATGDEYDPGEAAGRPWYVLVSNPDTAGTAYSYTTMMSSNRYNMFMGGELVFTKRLSNKWMANAAFTLQTQKSYYGDYDYLNPTNMWAVDGQQYGFTFGGASGKLDRDYFSRWTVQLSGLYQLPWDINISGTMAAHEGTFYQTSFTIRNDSLTGVRGYTAGMPTTTMNGRTRAPNVYNMSLKLEKMLRLSDAGRLYFSFDLFNVPNLHTVVRKYDINYGTFRYNGTTWGTWNAPGATSGQIYEILNPVVFRLGCRIQF
jgi:hypothetical protein